MNLATVQKVLDHYDDRFFRFRQKKAREGEPIVLTCRKGCSACCSEPCYAVKAEAMLIVSRLSPAQRVEVAWCTRTWLQRVADISLDRDTKPNAFVYRAANIPCPLLENGLCMVYKSRPAGCRIHAASGPRERCEDVALRPTQTFAWSPELIQETQLKMAEAMGHAEFIKQHAAGTHLGFLLAEQLGIE